MVVTSEALKLLDITTDRVRCAWSHGTWINK